MDLEVEEEVAMEVVAMVAKEEEIQMTQMVDNQHACNNVVLMEVIQ